MLYVSNMVIHDQRIILVVYSVQYLCIQYLSCKIQIFFFTFLLLFHLCFCRSSCTRETFGEASPDRYITQIPILYIELVRLDIDIATCIGLSISLKPWHLGLATGHVILQQIFFRNHVIWPIMNAIPMRRSIPGIATKCPTHGFGSYRRAIWMRTNGTLVIREHTAQPICELCRKRFCLVVR